MFILSSPSGAGKTTISRALLAADNDLELSVSMTTRSKRSNEQHGRDYYYVNQKDFNQMIEENKFLEYAKIFDNYYGTPLTNIEKIFAKNRDVLFDIDWQGRDIIASNNNDDLVSVFILPPSIKELERRLINRASDDMEVIKSRMAKASNEISHAYKYDYIIINYNVSESLKQICSILYAERLKRIRQTGLNQFINSLLD